MADEVSIRFSRWTVLARPEATRAAYPDVPSGSPGGCRCLNCANFAALREQIYPQAFRDLLGQLGVDWRKEAEVVEYPTPDKAKHDYGGWFHFLGSVVDGPEAWVEQPVASKKGRTMTMTRLDPTLSELLVSEREFRVFFTSRYLPGHFQGLRKSGVSVAAVEFFVRDVPWVVGDLNGPVPD